jgi:hypothetical protein
MRPEGPGDGVSQPPDGRNVFSCSDLYRAWVLNSEAMLPVQKLLGPCARDAEGVPNLKVFRVCARVVGVQRSDKPGSGLVSDGIYRARD